MSYEPIHRRRRRKFICGALEQAAAILGAVAASVLAVGLVGPYIAAVTGSSHVSPSVLVNVATSALVFALGAAVGSMALRGLARRVEDDAHLQLEPGAPSGESPSEPTLWT